MGPCTKYNSCIILLSKHTIRHQNFNITSIGDQILLHIGLPVGPDGYDRALGPAHDDQVTGPGTTSRWNPCA